MLSRKIPVKNTGFFPRYSAPKQHSILFLRTFLCMNTHVPSRQGCTARPTPTRPAPTRPARPHPARQPPPCPRPPCPLQPAPARSATCDRIFPSVPNFSRVLQDFSLVPEPDFSLVPELTYCVDATLTRRAERCALASPAVPQGA